MDVDPSKRLLLSELPKYTEDKWLKKVSHVKGAAGGGGQNNSDTKWLSDGISQLTMGSFQSVHSNAIEKNRILFTLLQHGVETTVDRTQKNSRIINWIQHGQTTDSTFDRGNAACAAVSGSASAADISAAAEGSPSATRSSYSEVLDCTTKSN